MTDNIEGANPHATYNRITTGVVRQPDGWHISIRMEHTETGAVRNELSQMRFPSEQAAENFAVKLAGQMRDRIAG